MSTQSGAPARPASSPPGQEPDDQPIRVRRAGARPLLQLTPTTLFIVLFFLVPVYVLMQRSFLDPGFTLDNYINFFQSNVLMSVLRRTAWVSLLITLLCLLLGYPYAYLMSTTSGWPKMLLLGLVLLPFWTSLLVRSIAWMYLLFDTGVINSLLMGMGIIDEPLRLIRTLFGVVLGMTQVMLPFMVLPLYASMQSIDQSLMKAASSLGGRPSVAFMKVYVPLTVPGIVAGATLVFIISLGFYITPALLGGRQNTFLGQLVVQQVTQVLNWGAASTMAVVLLLLTLLLLGLLTVTTRRAINRASQ